MQVLRDSGGMKINAGTQKVLEVLKVNRDKHVEIYEEALEGFKEKALAELKAELKRVKNTEPEELENMYVHLVAPKSNVIAYNTAITMMEYHTADTIDLTASQVQCFIQDQWEWSAEFASSTMAYAVGANR